MQGYLPFPSIIFSYDLVYICIITIMINIILGMSERLFRLYLLLSFYLYSRLRFLGYSAVDKLVWTLNLTNSFLITNTAHFVNFIFIKLKKSHKRSKVSLKCKKHFVKNTSISITGDYFNIMLLGTQQSNGTASPWRQHQVVPAALSFYFSLTMIRRQHCISTENIV